MITSKRGLRRREIYWKGLVKLIAETSEHTESESYLQLSRPQYERFNLKLLRKNLCGSFTFISQCTLKLVNLRADPFDKLTTSLLFKVMTTQ